MHYIKDDFVVYLCHIPRTGSRFVSYVLKMNGYQLATAAHNINVMCGFKEVVHLDREPANQHYMGFPIENDFALIRHPLDKFVRVGAFVEHLKCPLDIFSGSYDQFLYYMHDYVYDIRVSENVTASIRGFRSLTNNWFEPQINFIDNQTSLWRFENGINNNFYDWLFENTGVDIKNRLQENNLPKDWFDTAVKLDINNPNLQDNVLRYYNNDYQLWNSL